MEQKEKFIQEMLKQDKPFRQLCTEFGISEKTGCKWKNRFMTDGRRGLIEQSKAPLTHPNSLNEDTVIDLIKLKTAHPFWGAKKIRELYARTHPEEEIPSLSSVNRVLNKANLVKKRKIKPASTDCRRLHQHIKPEEVNDVWAIDFKGYWKSGGEKCEPFIVRELISRKILCTRLMTTKDSAAVRAVMTELFKKIRTSESYPKR